MAFISSLLTSPEFMPHGFCYLWDRDLIWLHVVSDVLIALAYFSIPLTLVYFVRKKRDLPFHWMFLMFGLFIVACGSTHVIEVWNLWHADYWLAGIVKLITAIASIITAILLFQLVPKALALPSPDVLKEANQNLIDRTEELARANAELASANGALLHSREQQRSLFDAIPYPVWVFDWETLDIKDVNQSAIASYGYSRKEFLSLTIKDLRPSEDIQALLEHIQNSPNGAGTTGTWRHRRKDGAIIDVEVTTGVVQFDHRDARLAIAANITERKQMEEALRESDEKLRLLVGGVQEYAILMLDLEGRITTWNEGAERIKGYRAEEIIGQHFSRFYTPEAAALGKPALELKKAAEQGRFEEEGWRIRKDGSRFWASVVVTPLRDRTGQLRGFAKVTRDITERKRIEEQLERQRSELARSNTELIAANKELEAFSYSVSHDLRAPLRSIDGFSLALLEDYEEKLDAEGKDNLHRVRAATQRMGVLIDDLLDLSRVTRAGMKVQKVDLSAMGRAVATELKNSQPGRRTEFHIQEGLEAHADSNLMRIALENLLENAWKFTSKRESARIEFGQTNNNGSRVYFIRDDGAGFDSARAGRLFGAFQRFHDKNEFPGTGVGLATVQRIIQRHGGRIWAESVLGKGATFYFTLLDASERGAESWQTK
jgi:PAS domain S-box-containing protein